MSTQFGSTISDRSTRHSFNLRYFYHTDTYQTHKAFKNIKRKLSDFLVVATRDRSNTQQSDDVETHQNSIRDNTCNWLIWRYFFDPNIKTSETVVCSWILIESIRDDERGGETYWWLHTEYLYHKQDKVLDDIAHRKTGWEQRVHNWHYILSYKLAWQIPCNFTARKKSVLFRDYSCKLSSHRSQSRGGHNSILQEYVQLTDKTSIGYNQA